MKTKSNLWRVILLLGLLVFFTVTSAFSGQQTDLGHTKLGCYPNGHVFNSFFPNATALRTIDYITEFGTVNINIVVGKNPSGMVAMAAAGLAERFGEYFQVIHISSTDLIGLMAQTVPNKYLEDKTMILCGDPAENELVKKLVDKGKSKVDWSKAKTGTIEVIPNAFGGSGSVVILGGSDADGSYLSITAMTEFVKHLIGAETLEANMLEADRKLQRGDIQGAAESYENVIEGVRIDSGATFYADIVDMDEAFPLLLKAESDLSRKFARFLKTNPSVEKANAELKNISGYCYYCHRRYLNYDRNETNRVKFIYSQYPGARLETEWAKKEDQPRVP